MKKNLVKDQHGNVSLMKSCLMLPMASTQVIKPCLFFSEKVYSIILMQLFGNKSFLFFCFRKYGWKRWLC